jgi:integrase
MMLGLAQKRGWWHGDLDRLFDGVELEEPAPKRWLRRHEVPVLLAAVDADEDGVVRDPGFAVAVRLALLAGLRAGEVLTRQWSDVDWDGSLLTIGPKAGLGWSWRPKNGRPRRVPLSAELRLVLKRWWMRQGRPGPEGWIVPTLEGERRRSGSWLGHRLQAVCAGKAPEGGERVPVLDPPVSFHGLRHSHASLALEAGVSMDEISEVLGHHSTEFTRRQYAHIDDRRLVGSADRLSAFLGAVTSVTSPVTCNRNGNG